MEQTTEVLVRHFGTCGRDGQIPYRLTEFMVALEHAISEIPPQYMGSATIEAEPDYELRECYQALRISYSRPETDEERAFREGEACKHWAEQRKIALERIAYCDEQLARVA